MILAEVEDAPPELIAGRYRVLDTLGEGSMAIVYRVVDESTGRRVALKQLKPRRGHSDNRVRFRHEFHTMAGLAHPAIIEVGDFGIHDGNAYYTMELLGTERLQTPLPPRKVALVVRDVAAALAFLHARGLVHRDVTLGNVRPSTDGRHKLIDFGVLGTFGSSGDIAGTPGYIAPEVVHGHPIDHRTDLFSLGVLAYRLRTGQRPYPPVPLEQIRFEWRQSPARPQPADDVPPGLDQLIMEMVSLDPLGRPSSCGEVVNRIEQLAVLEPLPVRAVAQGYLNSASLTGRRVEIEALRARIASLMQGTGGAVVIEAPSGTGKSRLLREAAIEAQVAGAIVAQVDSRAGDHAYGVIRALVRELLAAARDEADSACHAWASTVGNIVLEIAEHVGATPMMVSSGNPIADRLRTQAALCSWFRDVAATVPLVVQVDDVQRCDEASLAVLASLCDASPNHPLLLVLALRTDEVARNPATTATICKLADSVQLGNLTRVETEALVVELFGDIPNVRALAKRLCDRSGGNPMCTIELARHLVDSGEITFVGGEWHLPGKLGDEVLPNGLVETLASRLATLPRNATSVGEVLALVRHGPSIEQLVRLTGDHDEHDLFVALDALELAGLIIRREQRFRLIHDGVREGFLRGLDDARARRLHRHIGTVLAGEADEDRTAETGWHLVRGGAQRWGAAFLERAGRRTYEAQAFTDALPHLERALDIYEREAQPVRTRLELRKMILVASALTNYHAFLRWADVTVSMFARYAGMSLAGKLSRFLGRRTALALGIVIAGTRWLLSRPSRRGPAPLAALREFMMCLGYSASVYSTAQDGKALERLIDQADPLRALEERVPHSVYVSVLAFGCTAKLEYESALDHAQHAIDILHADRRTPIADADRFMALGGMHAIRAVVFALTSRGDPRGELEKLDELNLRIYERVALQVRALYHRFRGEETLARDYATRAELAAAQLGAPWQLEVVLALSSPVAYGYIGDTARLRDAVEHLRRLVSGGLISQSALDVHRARNAVMLGKLDEAETIYLEVAGAIEAGAGPVVETVADWGRMQFLMATDDLEGALVFGEEALVRAEQSPYRSAFMVIALAMTVARLGDPAAARKRLDSVAAEVDELGSPLLSGAFHEARAELALLTGDVDDFEIHLAHTHRWFESTGNPVLIARARHLESRLVGVDPVPRALSIVRPTEPLREVLGTVDLGRS